MIKVYGLDSCPDCVSAKNQIKESNRENEFEYIDISKDVKVLKEFIRIRDNNSVFDEVKKNGSIGIPCFVKEDGLVTLKFSDVGLKDSNNYCSLDDHLLGKKGC